MQGVGHWTKGIEKRLKVAEKTLWHGTMNRTIIENRLIERARTKMRRE